MNSFISIFNVLYLSFFQMEPLDDDLKIVRLLNAASRGDIKQMKS